MTRELVKWLWDAWRDYKKIEDQLHDIGISFEFIVKPTAFCHYFNAIAILKNNDYSDEMFEEFYEGNDFEHFWKTHFGDECIK